jgi:hypothetical protein
MRERGQWLLCFGAIILFRFQWKIILHLGFAACLSPSPPSLDLGDLLFAWAVRNLVSVLLLLMSWSRFVHRPSEQACLIWPFLFCSPREISCLEARLRFDLLWFLRFVVGRAALIFPSMVKTTPVWLGSSHHSESRSRAWLADLFLLRSVCASRSRPKSFIFSASLLTPVRFSRCVLKHRFIREQLCV